MKARIERFDSRVRDGLVIEVRDGLVIEVRDGLVIEVKRWRGLDSLTVSVTKDNSQANRNYAR